MIKSYKNLEMNIFELNPLRRQNFKAGLIFLTLSFSLFALHSTSAQQLENYQQTALENNPEIQSMSSSVEIAEEKINEVSMIPDTEFGLGYFISEPETRTGAQKARVSIRQMFPWFGTIQSRHKFAGSMVSVEEINLEIAKRKLHLEVSQQYFQIYEMLKKKEVLQQNIDLLEVYRTMALNSVEIGKASAVEVLRLKMRQNDLMEKMKNLQLQIETMEVGFNYLLNRTANAEVAIQDSLIIPLEHIVNSDLELHPELQRYDLFSESITYSEVVNQQESAPKFGLGVDYVSVQERQDMTFSDNGKDIIMPMVSFSVPIFNKKYRSVSRQNEIKQEQILLDRSSALNDLEIRLRKALNERSSARIKYEIQLDNLAQAKDAEELLLKQYETGTIDFDDVLDIQEIQLQIQLSLIEAVATWFQKDAVVDYLTLNK